MKVFIFTVITLYLGPPVIKGSDVLEICQFSRWENFSCCHCKNSRIWTISICRDLGTQFLDFYFLNFIDFSWRCATSGNDTISISLGFVGVCVSVTHFHFLLGFSSEIRLDELLDLSRFSDGCCSLGVVLVMHNNVNVEVGLLLAGVFFGNR